MIDAADVLADPPGTLAALCAALGIAFDPAMLAWHPGPRATDGIWARHWYGRVLASTEFEPETAMPAALTGRAAEVAEACAADYTYLRRFRITTPRASAPNPRPQDTHA